MHPAIVIIGAGPAGLCLSKELDRRGLDHLLLERGKVGQTWRKTPPDLTLLSPWWTNTLGWKHTWKHNPLAKVPAADFVAHLDACAVPLRRYLRESADVKSVREHTSGYCLVLGDGTTLEARIVVCCTGYFSKPTEPSPTPRSDGSIRSLHAAAIGNYDELGNGNGARVLIVGKRVTAGQLALELHHRGYRVDFSCRSRIEFRPSGWLAQLKEALYFPYEALRIRLQPRLHLDSYPAMDGGETRRLVENGRIGIKPVVSEIVDRRVRFADGTQETYALVVNATGYAPSLDYLSGLPELRWRQGRPVLEGFEAPGHPGLLFLGLDNLINFRSRYLRGIHADAYRLARIIALRAAR